MAIKTQRSDSPISTTDFEVTILELGDDGASLVLPVEAVRGLSSGKTNVIRYRNSSIGANTSTPYPGLTSPPGPVTLEGTWMMNLQDPARLLKWHRLVKGISDLNLATDFAISGVHKDILITPGASNEAGNLISLGLGAAKTIKIVNAHITNLSWGDLDMQTAAVGSWTAEFEYEDLVIEGA